MLFTKWLLQFVIFFHSDHPNGYYGSGFGFQTNHNNNHVFGFQNNNNGHAEGFQNNNGQVTGFQNNNNGHAEGFQNNTNDHVFTIGGEEVPGHGSQWDNSRRGSIKEEEEEDR